MGRRRPQLRSRLVMVVVTGLAAAGVPVLQRGSAQAAAVTFSSTAVNQGSSNCLDVPDGAATSALPRPATPPPATPVSSSCRAGGTLEGSVAVNSVSGGSYSAATHTVTATAGASTVTVNLAS